MLNLNLTLNLYQNMVINFFSLHRKFFFYHEQLLVKNNKILKINFCNFLEYVKLQNLFSTLLINSFVSLQKVLGNFFFKNTKTKYFNSFVNIFLFQVKKLNVRVKKKKKIDFRLASQIVNKKLGLKKKIKDLAKFFFFQKSKSNVLFWFQFYKNFLHNNLLSNMFDIEKNYTAFYKEFEFYRFFSTKEYRTKSPLKSNIGEIQRQRLLDHRDFMYEIIADNFILKRKTKKQILFNNNVKFLKKKYWRLPFAIATYIPSTYRKRYFTHYHYWFNRLYFSRYVNPILKLKKNLHNRFSFVKGLMKNIYKPKYEKRKKIKLKKRIFVFLKRFKCFFVKQSFEFKKLYKCSFLIKKEIEKVLKKKSIKNFCIFKKKEDENVFFKANFFSLNLFFHRTFSLFFLWLKKRNKLGLNSFYFNIFPKKVKQYSKIVLKTKKRIVKRQIDDLIFKLLRGLRLNKNKWRFFKKKKKHKKISFIRPIFIRCKTKLKQSIKTLKKKYNESQKQHILEKNTIFLKVKKFVKRINVLINEFQLLPLFLRRKKTKLKLFKKSNLKKNVKLVCSTRKKKNVLKQKPFRFRINSFFPWISSFDFLNYRRLHLKKNKNIKKSNFSLLNKKIKTKNLNKKIKRESKNLRLKSKLFNRFLNWKKLKFYYSRISFDVYPNVSYSFFKKSVVFENGYITKSEILNINLPVWLKYFLFRIKKNVDFFSFDLKKELAKCLGKGIFFLTNFLKYAKVSSNVFLRVLLNFQNLYVKSLYKWLGLFREKINYNLVNFYAFDGLKSRKNGNVIFTLNSNTVFLTITAPDGSTIFQTSTGSIHRLKRKKVFKKGMGFKLEKKIKVRKYSRLLKEVDKMKGKNKKTKQTFIKQLLRQQKGKKRKKLPKGKMLYITHDFIRPVFNLLEEILLRFNNSKTKNVLLKFENLKIRIQNKIVKLKKKKVKNEKLILKLEKQLKSINFEITNKKRKFYAIQLKKKVMPYINPVLAKVNRSISFVPNTNNKFLKKKNKKKNKKFLNTIKKKEYLRQKFFYSTILGFKQRQIKKNTLYFILRKKKNFFEEVLNLKKKILDKQSFSFVFFFKGNFQIKTLKFVFLGFLRKMFKKFFVQKININNVLMPFAYQKYKFAF